MIGKFMREGACLAILGLVGIGLATAPAAPSSSKVGGAKMVALTKAVFVKVDNIADKRMETKISKTAISIDKVFDKVNQDKIETKVDTLSGITISRRNPLAATPKTVTRVTR